MLNQTKYNSITVLQSSITEQSVMVDCPDREEKTAIVQSYSTDRADEILAAHTSGIDRLIPLRHPNIQSIIDVFVEENTLHLVTGAVQGKRAATQVPLSAERCEKLLKDILPVLIYLHNQSITHGNISPDTILFQAQNQPVLTDFQVVTELKIAAGSEVHPPIDRQLREIPVANIPSGQQFDLYSLGVTTIYLLSNRELNHLYDPTTQKWQWENYIGSSSGKLLRAIDQLINQPTSAAEVFQEFQIQSRVILDAPTPIQDTIDRQSSIYPPTQTPPTSTSDRTTTVLPTPTNFQSTPTNIPQPPAENKSLQTLLIGGIGGALILFVGMSIGKNNPNPSPQTSSLPSPNHTSSSVSPVSIPSVSPSTTISTSITSISKDEAVNLVKRWLNARSQMFAPPYNQEVGKDLATGKAYSDKIHGPSSDGTDTSTLEWLKNFDYYYVYNSSEIGEIKRFQEDGNDTILELVVREDKIQYDKQRKVVPKNSGKSMNFMRYRLRYDSDKWKIADIEELQKVKN
jgi:serine/threonine protein kinase